MALHSNAFGRLGPTKSFEPALRSDSTGEQAAMYWLQPYS
jgi:hypothetical protein